MGLLENKVVLITGASRGIGKAIAEECLLEGATVAFSYLSSNNQTHELEIELSKNGGRVKGFLSDASNYDAAQKLVDDVVEEFGTIDVLVNNASAFYPTPINNASLNDLDKLVGSNLKGPLFLIKGLHEIIANNNGSIINITDTNLTKGVANFSVYAAAKGGLESITKSLARELAPNIND